MKKFYVYALVDPRRGKKNSVFYIGKGKTKGRDERNQVHLREAIKGSHINPKLQNKIKKIVKAGLVYGVDFLFSTDSEDECFAMEVYWIAFYGRKTLCNLTDGGEGASGSVWSEAKHAQMSAFMKGNKWGFKPGHKPSAETIAKMSASQKGHKRTAKDRHSEVTRKQMSASQRKRKPPTEETKEKMSVGMKAVWVNKKESGWKVSHETIDKLSAATKVRHANNLSTKLKQLSSKISEFMADKVIPEYQAKSQEASAIEESSEVLHRLIDWCNQGVQGEGRALEVARLLELDQTTVYRWCRKRGSRELKWTKAKVMEVAMMHETRADFRNGSPAACSRARKNGWMDEVCAHMKPILESWSFEKVRSVALKCETRSEFQKRFSGADKAARRNGWMDDVCSHMHRKSRWTLEDARHCALECKTRHEFQKRFKGIYLWVLKRGWLDQVCSHMPIRRKSHLTLEEPPFACAA